MRRCIRGLPTRPTCARCPRRSCTSTSMGRCAPPRPWTWRRRSAYALDPEEARPAWWRRPAAATRRSCSPTSTCRSPCSRRLSALRRAATELVEDMGADGVPYGEVRWAPRLHLENGLSVHEVLEAVAEGLAAGMGNAGAAGLVVLIVTAMRSHPPGANVELARTAAAVGPPWSASTWPVPRPHIPRRPMPLPSGPRRRLASRSPPMPARSRARSASARRCGWECGASRTGRPRPRTPS